MNKKCIEILKEIYQSDNNQCSFKYEEAESIFILKDKGLVNIKYAESPIFYICQLTQYGRNYVQSLNIL